ncbi:NO-inducible flavohemoprotein [Aureibacillus halotolerans]|uniref:Flavohemoprotein n=1 Tax=Aureibacillus halotolerans TaxID=1508390 RepID=A0A4R6U3W5_9BACI|nr:NO-inducible flavohemoprotein [Aureibacillus halotolerans]TDQ40751.1 nitric oxide dioxygenase [Aureibacillus halotolerans]
MENSNQVLDEKTIAVIKQTVPVLQAHGNEITKTFYKRMLTGHPELNHIFNQTNQSKGAQPRALAQTVYAAAANIDQLDTILPHVKQIAQKHTSLNIRPEQYPIVGHYLLGAIKEVLGAAADDTILDAWAKAYGVIANIFIFIEKEMYTQKRVQVGGWEGFRDFTVIKKRKESDVITSFYLKPTDDGPVAAFEPGQYITVKAHIEGQSFTQLRQYSLSDAPDKAYYRISVKREDGSDQCPSGIVSTYLHRHVQEGDILPLSAPSGEFTLQHQETKPLVLISGGVGLTPLMSILETVIEKQPERQVLFIHAAHTGTQHAMKDRVRTIAKERSNVTAYTVYAQPEEKDIFDKQGRIDDAWLQQVLPASPASYYFCGPKGFMKDIYLALKKKNVPTTDIHFEIFGPAEDITA